VFRKIRTGADDGHVPFQDVQDLRGLVQAGLADEFPDPGQSWIVFRVESGSVFVAQVGRIGFHGTEFIHLVDASLFTKTGSVVEEGTFVIKVKDGTQEDEYEKKERKTDQCDPHIHHSFKEVTVHLVHPLLVQDFVEAVTDVIHVFIAQ